MAKKEQKLTKAELRRKEAHEALCGEMAQKGYEKQDLIISMGMANLVAPLLALPLIVLLCWVYYLCNPGGSKEGSLLSTALFFPLLLVLLAVHEGIHGLVWGCFAKGHFRSIEFGVMWQALAPYCTCSEPMRRWQYILGGMAPTLVLGFGLAELAAALGQFWLLKLAGLMVLGGGADMLVTLKLLLHRRAGKELLCCDHPYDCGLVVFERGEK